MSPYGREVKELSSRLGFMQSASRKRRLQRHSEGGSAWVHRGDTLSATVQEKAQGNRRDNHHLMAPVLSIYLQGLRIITVSE